MSKSFNHFTFLTFEYIQKYILNNFLSILHSFTKEKNFSCNQLNSIKNLVKYKDDFREKIKERNEIKYFKKVKLYFNHNSEIKY